MHQHSVVQHLPFHSSPTVHLILNVFCEVSCLSMITVWGKVFAIWWEHTAISWPEWVLSYPWIEIGLQSETSGCRHIMLLNPWSLSLCSSPVKPGVSIYMCVTARNRQRKRWTERETETISAIPSKSRYWMLWHVFPVHRVDILPLLGYNTRCQTSPPHCGRHATLSVSSLMAIMEDKTIYYYWGVRYEYGYN